MRSVAPLTASSTQRNVLLVLARILNVTGEMYRRVLYLARNLPAVRTEFTAAVF